MYKATVIVCDTEVETRTLLAEVLEDKLHYRVIALARASDIINCLYENHTSLPEVVLLDVSTQDVAIGKAQEELQLRFPHLPVLALTHYGDMKQASEALARGAMDYLARPVSHQRLKVTVDNAVRQHRLAVEVSRLRREMTMGIDLDFLPADNPRLRRLMPRDVSAESRIILYGEQGVGKEALARAIHTHTARPGSPFVSVSCAPLAEIQVWGTLFGSADCKEEGGDDSQESPCGQLAAARGGTLLLNDVEALSHTVQARLAERLSYLNQQPASRQNMTDQSVRLMVATTLSISELKQSDRLSPEMKRYLSGRVIQVPSLRESRGDIDGLAHYFVGRYALQENPVVEEITPQAIALLESYDWPGNVMEMERILYRAVIMSDEPQIDTDHLLPYMPPSVAVPESSGFDGLHRTMIRSRRMPLTNERGDVRRLRDLEADMINFAITFYDGRISEVARKLGIGRSTLYRKLHDLDIKVA